MINTKNTDLKKVTKAQENVRKRKHKNEMIKINAEI